MEEVAVKLFGYKIPHDRRIHNERQLNRALWDLKRVEEELKQLEHQRDQWLQQVNEWYAEAALGPSQEKTRLVGLIREYHERILAENPRKKTLKTLAGTVSARTTKKVRWGDEAELANWIREHMGPEYLRIKYAPNKEELKKYAHGDVIVNPGTGEIIPGVTVEEETKFYIKPAEGTGHE